MSSTACWARFTPTWCASADNRWVPGAPCFLEPRASHPGPPRPQVSQALRADSQRHFRPRRPGAPRTRPGSRAEQMLWSVAAQGGAWVKPRAGAIRSRCVASPFGDGTIAARATQHRTTCQSEYGGYRVAFATCLTTVGHRSEYFNERPWMCYHEAPPVARVAAHGGDAGRAKSHLEHNPLSSREPYATPMRKLNAMRVSLLLVRHAALVFSITTNAGGAEE